MDLAEWYACLDKQETKQTNKKGISKFFYGVFVITFIFIAWFLLTEQYWIVAKWLSGL